jgi:hypothetical protein
MNKDERITAYVPTVRVPQPDGAMLLRPGAAVRVMVGVPLVKFARTVGLNPEYVRRLCEEGHVKCRRMTPKARSRWLIDEGEVERFLDQH